MVVRAGTLRVVEILSLDLRGGQMEVVWRDNYLFLSPALPPRARALGQAPVAERAQLYPAAARRWY